MVGWARDKWTDVLEENRDGDGDAYGVRNRAGTESSGFGGLGNHRLLVNRRHVRP